MIIVHSVEEVRKNVKEWKKAGLTVGFVPTMGALHEGHASLISEARKECDKVITSIFVNPTQFAAAEDADKYPKTFENDCKILEVKGCDLVFNPQATEIYPKDFATYVEVQSEMTSQLCGKSRPGHFKGVCTVVTKLFNIVVPDRAYFGKKDAQQLAVIKQMTRDLQMDIDVIGCPTIREADGLASSSRNVYLDEEQRKASTIIYKSIVSAKKLIEDLFDEKETDTTIPSAAIKKNILEILKTESLGNIEYVEVVDGRSLAIVENAKRGDLVAIAVYFGKTLLIDNFDI